jgi:putative FmdB family regulatory protein
MPIYQYSCPKCGLQFERKQSFNEPSEASCPKCQRKARRLFKPAPVIFKGSGFYVTDNRKNGETPDSGMDKTTEAKSTGEKDKNE